MKAVGKMMFVKSWNLKYHGDWKFESGVSPDWPVSGKFPVPLDYITDEEYSIEDVVYQPL